MVVNRKEYNKVETHKHIRRIFLELYTQKGIDGVTVNELCRNAGIVKSTFYTYFEDKYSVLDEIEQDLLLNLTDINSRLEDIDVSDVLHGLPLEAASKTVDFIHEHLDEFRAIMGANGDPRFEPNWRKKIADSFKDKFLQEKGDVRSAGLACSIFASTLIGIYRYYIFEVPDIAKEDFALILGNTFKYALMDFQASTLLDS